MDRTVGVKLLLFFKLLEKNRTIQEMTVGKPEGASKNTP